MSVGSLNIPRSRRNVLLALTTVHEVGSTPGLNSDQLKPICLKMQYVESDHSQQALSMHRSPSGGPLQRRILPLALTICPVNTGPPLIMTYKAN